MPDALWSKEQVKQMLRKAAQTAEKLERKEALWEDAPNGKIIPTGLRVEHSRDIAEKESKMITFSLPRVQEEWLLKNKEAALEVAWRWGAEHHKALLRYFANPTGMLEIAYVRQVHNALVHDTKLRLLQYVGTEKLQPLKDGTIFDPKDSLFARDLLALNGRSVATITTYVNRCQVLIQSTPSGALFLVNGQLPKKSQFNRNFRCDTYTWSALVAGWNHRFPREEIPIAPREEIPIAPSKEATPAPMIQLPLSTKEVVQERLDSMRKEVKTAQGQLTENGLQHKALCTRLNSLNQCIEKGEDFLLLLS